jgi:hypothetical protein
MHGQSKESQGAGVLGVMGVGLPVFENFKIGEGWKGRNI